jgi:pyruvate/2-oxoglutarate dehydrogenase complex dihydrolipoamide acyltransferase (E2) component
MSKLTKFQALKAAPEAVAQENGKTVIQGVSVCTAGPALGHGVHLDSDFIDAVYRFGTESNIGIKSRFGHPSMCSESLGKFVGRFKNFRKVDDGNRVVADMHLAESAKDSPGGDLHAYIVKMAKEDPQAFATSIVFKMGPMYRKTESGEKVRVAYVEDEGYMPVDPDIDESDLSEELYATCEDLFACDFVDEPAANPGGLFSEFHGTTIAGKVGMFFDQEPEILDALLANPEMVSIIKNHGDKVESFLAKIKELKSMSTPEETEVPETPAPAPQEPETPAEPAPEAAPEVPALSLSEYRQYVKEFGADIADKVADEGGGRPKAVELYAAKLKAEAESLKAENEALKKQLSKKPTSETEADAASFQDKPVTKKRSLTSKITP